MRNYVIINGVNSLTIQGLAINNLPPITKPMIRTQREEIDGRDGDIVTELGYSAYDKSMEIGLYGNFDIDEIIKYFTGEGTIVFSNEEDKYYNFKILDQIDYEKLLKFKTATITFHCQPFKYPVEETPIEGEAITVTGSGSNITLENTVVAPMDMKLKGNTIQDGTPTPDSPVPVQIVSGDNSINVCGKNLIPITYAKIKSSNTSGSWNNNVYSYNGLTFTVNEDLSVVINGTASGNTAFNLIGTTNLFVDINISNGNYVLSGSTGGEQNMSTWGIYMAIKHSDNTNETQFCYNGDLAFTKVEGDTFFPVIRIGSGTVCNNIEIKPMIRKSGTNSTYQPYTSSSYPISLSSKNLCHIDNFGTTISGLTITASDNTIILNGTNTQAISANSTFWHNIKFTAKEESKYKTTLTHTVPSMAFGYYLNGSGSLIGYDTTLQPGEYTLGIYIPTGTYSNFKIKIQIEKGTTATDYVDYYDYGELCKIGTYQDKIDKSSGKNLLDMNNLLVGIYTPSATPTISGSGDVYKSFNLTLKKGTYSLYSSSSIYAVRDFSSYDYSSQVTLGSFPANTKSTFTITQDATVYFSFRKYDNTAWDSTKDKVWLVEGSDTIEYEPYGTGWYVKKEIGKVVLDENSNVGVSVSTNYSTCYLSDLLNVATTTSSSVGYSNYFKINYNNVIGNAYFTSSKYLYMIMDTSINNSATFKTWLGTNNVSVYYVLATPTYETITDTTLIGQLEALKPYSYNPVTNITQTNNDAPFELDVSLSYTNTMNVNNVGNIYAKPVLTIEGSGTIGIILNDIEVLSVDLGTDEKITIDVPNLQAYNPDNDVLLNRNVTGDYMKLLINDGDNTIAFSGSVTSATLTNYTRWI